MQEKGLPATHVPASPMATDQPPVPRSPREQCQCRVGRYRPLEQQTCTDSNLEDSGCTMPTQGLSSPTCGCRRLFSVNAVQQFG